MYYVYSKEHQSNKIEFLGVYKSFIRANNKIRWEIDLWRKALKKSKYDLHVIKGGYFSVVNINFKAPVEITYWIDNGGFFIKELVSSKKGKRNVHSNY